ncbi:hypothetical protein BDM02DRAFT_1893178 [Thelephora ganbajun]|uniref:Uncharacterized protein n=1 Tax=Thelephora ganbajun TaxID=370292 RepID=A0ACB6ZVC4_THEGA|nr:hypothetical protein BDM02DRAFT_1893178 [Thelephora ganbajun]
MTNGALSRDSNPRARKSARGKHPNSSLAIISTALSESPLLKSDTDDGAIHVQEDDIPMVPNNVQHSQKAERPPARHPSTSSSVSSVRVSPDPVTNSDARRGEISDSCYRNIVELFAKRYITTFDKDHLALESAYTSQATFSCRFIPGSCSPPPYHFTKCSTGTLQGPLNIIQALSSFSRRIVFVPPTESALDVTIEILRLPDMNYFVTLIFDTVVEDVGVSTC